MLLSKSNGPVLKMIWYVQNGLAITQIKPFCLLFDVKYQIQFPQPVQQKNLTTFTSQQKKKRYLITNFLLSLQQTRKKVILFLQQQIALINKVNAYYKIIKILMIDKKQLDKLTQRGVNPVIAARFSVFQNCPMHFSIFSPSNLPILLQCGHFMCQQCQESQKKCAVCNTDIKIKQRSFKFFFQVMQDTTSLPISQNPEAEGSKTMEQNEYLNIDRYIFQLIFISTVGQINGNINMQKFQSAYSHLEKNQNQFKSFQTLKLTKIRAAKELYLKMIKNNQNHFQLLKEIQIGMVYRANVEILFKMKDKIPVFHTRQVYFKLTIKNQENFIQVINQIQYFYYSGPYKLEPEQPCQLVAHIVYYVQEKLKKDAIMSCNESPMFVRLDNMHNQNSFVSGMMTWIDLTKEFQGFSQQEMNSQIRQKLNTQVYFTIQQRSQTCQKTVYKSLQSDNGSRAQKLLELSAKIEAAKSLTKYNILSGEQNKFFEGLPNVENTNFMNAMFHCLYAPLTFRGAIMKKSEDRRNGYYTHLLGLIFKMITYNPPENVKRQMLEVMMKQLKQIVESYEMRTQQDSRQFLFKLLSLIEQQFPKVMNTNFTLGYIQTCNLCKEFVQFQQDYLVKQSYIKCSNSKCEGTAKVIFKNCPPFLILLKQNNQKLKAIEQFQHADGGKFAYSAIANCVYWRSGRSGHYIAHRYNREKQWGMFNDSTFSSVQKDQSFRHNVLFAVYQYKKHDEQIIDKSFLNPLNFTNQDKSNNNKILNSLINNSKAIGPSNLQIKQILKSAKNCLKFQPSKKYQDKVQNLFKKDKFGNNVLQTKQISYFVDQSHEFFKVKVISQKEERFYKIAKTSNKQKFLKQLQNCLIKEAQQYYDMQGRQQYAKYRYYSFRPSGEKNPENSTNQIPIYREDKNKFQKQTGRQQKRKNFQIKFQQQRKQQKIKDQKQECSSFKKNKFYFSKSTRNITRKQFQQILLKSRQKQKFNSDNSFEMI